MHFITRKHLSRRKLLRGAGSAVALPLLDAMIPAATAQNETAAQITPRVGFTYFPHGATMEKWTPTTVGADFEFTEILKPLLPFRDRVNVISGLSLPLAYGNDASAGANHTRSSAVFLSGAEPGTGAQASLGISVDQIIAQVIGQDTPLPSLEMGIEDGSLSCGSGLSCAYRNTISWQSDTSPLPMENNPQIIFERLFGDGSTAQQRQTRRDQSRSLLDSVMEEVNYLERDLTNSDKHRLGEFLEDVREIERRIQLSGQLIPNDLAVPEAPAGIPDDFEAHIKLLLDLQVLAWQAEITRISTLMLAKEVSNATYPNSGIRDPFHNLSHHSNSRENMDKFAVLNTYHVSMFAYLLEKLQSVSEGDGTLLDHSMLLYGSGMSDGNQHNHDPLPIVLAGGAGGRLEGGRHIRSNNPKDPVSNLLLGMLQVLDIPVTQFGDSTGVLEL